MSDISPEKVETIISAPVVSTDSLSPEAILARNAKRLQVQAEVDSKYDTVLENFYCGPEPINKPLLISFLTVGLLFAGATLFGGKARR
jgi:hypothetical protein